MGDRKKNVAAEMSRRGAAAMAHATAGRARCLDRDRRKYDRKREGQSWQRSQD